MRGFIVMAMFAVSLSHAGSHKYSEVRNLELDASGLSDMFIDAGAGALIVNGVEGSDEIVVVATIVVEGEEEEAIPQCPFPQLFFKPGISAKGKSGAIALLIFLQLF